MVGKPRQRPYEPRALASPCARGGTPCDSRRGPATRRVLVAPPC